MLCFGLVSGLVEELGLVLALGCYLLVVLELVVGLEKLLNKLSPAGNNLEFASGNNLLQFEMVEEVGSLLLGHLVCRMLGLYWSLSSLL